MYKGSPSYLMKRLLHNGIITGLSISLANRNKLHNLSPAAKCKVLKLYSY